MPILGSHGEMVLEAPLELGEGAGHGQRQGVHVAHFLPQTRAEKRITRFRHFVL